MPTDPRHKPPEDAVREQLRETGSGEAEPGDTEPEAPPPGSPAEGSSDPDPDPEPDEPDPDEPEAAVEPEAEPEDPATVLERERDEYLALAQRTQADFENWRKRAAKEAAAAGQRAKSGLVRELLPVVDNLERALRSGGEADDLAGGVKLVHSELISVLQRNGVEPFDPGGEPFDPSEHEALSTRPDEDAGSGVVLDVVEKGYRLNGSVLRPARVVVSG